MSRDLEYEIKGAVADLADQGRSVNLAAAAIRDGRHIVRRRRAVSAGATFVVLAILVVPFALHRPTSRLVQPGAAPVATAPAPAVTAPVPTAAAPSPTSDSAPDLVDPVPGLAALPYGMVYGSLPRTDGSTLVYNRSTGQYVKLPYTGVVPSPSGSTAAVNNGKQVGLVSLDSGEVRWTVGPVPSGTGFDWSPDGTQLTYLSQGKKAGNIRVTVVTVAKNYATTIGGDIVCPQNCVSAWLPDGTAIAVSGADGKLPVRLYDTATGKLRTGLERVTGVLAAGHGVSSDGTFAVTQLGAEASVNVTGTGESVLSLPDPAAQIYWATGQELMVVRAGSVVVYSIAGDALGTYPLPPGTLVKAASFPTLMRG